jgi:dipeptidyl aminopeptidase/acylaminoacyl peptidase
MRQAIYFILVGLLTLGPAAAGEVQSEETQLAERIASVEEKLEQTSFTLDRLLKKVDDLLWFERVGDVADIDKVYLPTVPNPHEEPTYGIANERHPFKMWSYAFIPKGLDRGKKHPLLMLPHGGVHSDFGTYYTHIIRELMAEGYVVVAPEYRGSTGYGKEYHDAIDYGGLETDDVVAARDWALEVLEFADPRRVGILGWSHGGLIALMAVFDHPEKFGVAYAGVPVSDLVARMGYQTQDYRELYSADYHVGKTANEDVEETNDRDVHVLEVEHLIAQLKAADKEFQYKVYQDIPGGHSFNRMDTAAARESRREIYEFLARYLKK